MSKLFKVIISVKSIIEKEYVIKILERDEKEQFENNEKN